jgi:hypothetical protein
VYSYECGSCGFPLSTEDINNPVACPYCSTVNRISGVDVGHTLTIFGIAALILFVVTKSHDRV